MKGILRLTSLLSVALAVAAAASTGQDTVLPGGLVLSADYLRFARGAASDTVYLEGSVKISQGTLVVTGDSGFVSTLNRIAMVVGSVKVRDGEALIEGEHLTYRAADSVAVLTGGLTFSETGVLVTGDAGRYSVTDSTALIWGNVTMHRDDVVVKSDTLRYSRGKSISIAWGDVNVSYSKEGTEILGTRLVFDRSLDEATITGGPRMYYKGPNGRNDILVEAPTMKLLQGKEKMLAFGGVSLTKGLMHVESDSMIFLPSQDLALFLGGRPRAWNERITASGDSLEAHLTDSGLDRLVSRGEAEAEYKQLREDGTRGERSEIKGRDVTLYLVEERAERVEVKGEAWNLYIPSEEDSTRGVGPNVAEGDELTIFLSESDVSRAVFKGRAHGDYEFLPGDVEAGPGANWDKVDYSAEEIEFKIQEQIIDLTSESVIKYRSLTLKSEKARFYAEDELLVATGAPELWDGERMIEGETMGYDLDRQEGDIIGARTTFERGFYSGERIKRKPDASLNVVDGGYTTCDLPEPHYHFSSRAMKVYLNDKVVARPIIFYIRKVPVFGLPFYIFSIKKGRHSGILLPDFEFGFSQDKGRFMRNVGYYWAPNDYFDTTAKMDYYQNSPRWLGYLEGRYNVRYLMSGQSIFTFSNDFGTKRRRWSIRGNHMQTLGEGMDLRANVDRVSDPQFQLESGLGRSIQDRVNGNLRSNVSLTKRWSGGTVTGVYERDEVLGEGLTRRVTETAPSLSLVLSRRTLAGTLGRKTEGGGLDWLLNTSYSISSRFVNRRQTIPVESSSETDGTAVADSVSSRAAGSYDVSIVNARKYFGWLDLNPSLTFSQAWFDEDNLGNSWARATSWRTSLAIGTTAYGTFYPNIGPLVGFRHVFSPRATLSYQPGLEDATYVDEEGNTHPRFPSGTGISISTVKSKTVSFSLDNRFEAKVKKGDRIVKLTDLVVLRLAGSYDFLYKEKGAEKPLSNISTSLGIRPPGVDLTTSVDGVWDPYSQALQSLRVYNSFSISGSGGSRRGGEVPEPGENVEEGGVPESEGAQSGSGNEPAERGWQLGLSFGLNWDRYPGSLTTRLTGSTSFNLTDKWRVSYSSQVDLNERDIVYQEIVLHRDLHCWEAQFTRRYSGRVWESYFRIAAKLLPELKYERGARDRGNFLGGFWQ
jgi:lipopolysaccharide assembly outer membrane protein LptD (OstA)